MSQIVTDFLKYKTILLFYYYERKTWKGKMIKNMLKGRK